jgi:hypothetical protein
MKQTDVVRWLYDEIATALQDTTLVSLSDVDKHIDVAQNREAGGPYPFVGIDHDGSTPKSAGIGGGNTFVDELVYGDDGLLDAIIYRRDKEFPVVIHTLTDGDQALRSDLGETIEDHFALLARREEVPADVDVFEVGETTTSGRPDTFVYGDGLDMDITYSRFARVDDPVVAEDVDLTIDAADDASGTNSDTAFDDLVSG